MWVTDFLDIDLYPSKKQTYKKKKVSSISTTWAQRSSLPFTILFPWPHGIPKLLCKVSGPGNNEKHSEYWAKVVGEPNIRPSINHHSSHSFVFLSHPHGLWLPGYPHGYYELFVATGPQDRLLSLFWSLVFSHWVSLTWPGIGFLVTMATSSSSGKRVGREWIFSYKPTRIPGSKRTHNSKSIASFWVSPVIKAAQRKTGSFGKRPWMRVSEGCFLDTWSQWLSIKGTVFLLLFGMGGINNAWVMYRKRFEERAFDVEEGCGCCIVVKRIGWLWFSPLSSTNIYKYY